jgi:23S rRNA (cytosine1962-C5)-methyltransferase
VQALPKVSLKFGKERSLLRFHPWVFSGAIHRIDDAAKEGGRVQVFSGNGQALGWGHYQKGSITVRLLEFGNVLPDDAFWKTALMRCLKNRKALGFPGKHTTTFRLVHGEGDGLPGLIIDIYGAVAVVQCHSIGMFAERKLIADALMNCAGDFITAVYDKSAESLGNKEGNGWLAGTGSGDETCVENQLKFKVDFATGQKTGFFIDQRDNRALLQQYAQGKKVLNTFCYTGGFSVAALAGGAVQVDSVDSSRKAIELTDHNVALNGFGNETHQSLVEDVPEWIRSNPKKYDIIVLDPPAFAKHMDARHRAVQAYKRLNVSALNQINSGGLLFTFSCSQVVDKQLFRNTITAAAIESGRSVRLLHQLSQPADHPVSLFHPEGEYLKGLVLQVD